MQGVILYMKEKLLLKVNRGKLKVRRPDEGILLGFSFRAYKGKWIIRVAKRSESPLDPEQAGIQAIYCFTNCIVFLSFLFSTSMIYIPFCSATGKLSIPFIFCTDLLK